MKARGKVVTPEQRKAELDERGGLPSASAFDAEFRCNGRNALVATVGDRQSDAAKSGQEVHEAWEGKRDPDTLKADQQYTLGQLQYIEAQTVAEYGFGGATVVREERLWWADGEFNARWSARIDVGYVFEGERVLIMDGKTGWGVPVAIEMNWQIRAQAVLAWRKWGAKEVVAGIVCPHSPDTDRAFKTFKPEELAHWEREIEIRLPLIRGDRPRTPHVIACRYCPARAVCKEFRVFAGAGGGEADWDAMLPGERGDRLDVLKMIEETFEAEREKARALLRKNKDAVRGWRIVESQRAAITSESGAADIIKATWGDTVLEASKQIGLTRLQAALVAKGQTKDGAKQEVARVLEPVIAYTPSESLKQGRAR